MDQKADIKKDLPPEKIEQDIARTREEMSGTVNEIRERLTPSHLKQQAKQSIRETASGTVDRIKDSASRMGQSLGHSARDAGSSVMSAVKSNPVPLAMIGAGIAWLVMSRSDVIQKQRASLREQAETYTEKAQEKASELSGRARESSSRLAGKASESAARVKSTAQERTRAASDWIQQTVEHNPLGVALTLFGVGALIGFALPESEREQQVMGQASETLLSRAKETAQRTIKKAQQAAERAVHTAQEEFKKSAA